MRGSAHNDMFTMGENGLKLMTNRSGGILGGITCGAPIVFRVAFKPPASIALPQNTVDYNGNPVELEVQGRHDPCVVPRAPPVVDSLVSLVLADHALQGGFIKPVL